MNLKIDNLKEISIYKLKLTLLSFPSDVLGRLETDLRFDCPELLMVQRYARKSPKQHYYTYRVTQRPNFHVMGACTREWMGVCHADELFYLFTIPDQKSEAEKKLSWSMIRAWTSFATHRDPGYVSSVRWEEAFPRDPSNPNNISNYHTRFMRLEYGKYEMISGFYKDTCEGFWYDKLLEKF